MEEIEAELEYTKNEGDALVMRYGPLRLIGAHSYEQLLATTESFDAALAETREKLTDAETKIRELMAVDPRLGGPTYHITSRAKRQRGAGARGGGAGAGVSAGGALKRSRTLGGGREDSV